jgi:putative FmdB family regulatory protein
VSPDPWVESCKENLMPAYDFKCTQCSTVFEITRASSDDSPVPCPECAAQTKRVFTAVGVHFKGSGFHNTDYRPKPKDAAAPCESAGSSGACSKCPAASE